MGRSIEERVDERFKAASMEIRAALQEGDETLALALMRAVFLLGDPPR